MASTLLDNIATLFSINVFEEPNILIELTDAILLLPIKFNVLLFKILFKPFIPMEFLITLFLLFKDILADNAELLVLTDNELFSAALFVS